MLHSSTLLRKQCIRLDTVIIQSKVRFFDFNMEWIEIFHSMSVRSQFSQLDCRNKVLHILPNNAYKLSASTNLQNNCIASYLKMEVKKQSLLLVPFSKQKTDTIDLLKIDVAVESCRRCYRMTLKSDFPTE